MHVCSLSTIRANEKWRLMSDEIKNEVAEFIGNFKFPGKGNKVEPVITFKGALKLVMMVSGEKAALYRSAMVKILSRYYAGDGSLTEEIEANARSDAPIAQMARASLMANVSNELSYKRKLEELEVSRFEVEIERQKTEIEAKKLANAVMKHEHLSKLTCSIRELSEDRVMDERTRLILRDNFLNMAMLQDRSQALLTNGQPNKPISLSMVAAEMGLKIPPNNLISVGMDLKKRYMETHGREPPKHDQLCGGRMTKVNSYMESDRALMEGVLRESFGRM